MTKRKNEIKKKKESKINIEKRKTFTSWAIVVEGQRFVANVCSMSNVPHLHKVGKRGNTLSLIEQTTTTRMALGEYDHKGSMNNKVKA